MSAFHIRERHLGLVRLVAVKQDGPGVRSNSIFLEGTDGRLSCGPNQVENEIFKFECFGRLLLV